ncbi:MULTISPECIES: sugar-binding transcriptional regulator [Vibrio]|jgi:DNA-binding transcriptional regulator LsrR (DeoR family)|uniref:Sorbitol operon regulator n=3 Tax=Gammaproteobacteria TaxID=1236 RepID=A0A240ERJ8_9VIBR|nr:MULTISPECIES: sugar-binding transcriptional regulator [Vibrio]AYV20208.1 sugar-binding transcriptional regulator [Vibrio mediterranei]EDL52289.1 transcriptional regulator [Vibrio mediterranei AK1]MCF4172658.1 sugar-binding transcriptional regulator [Vibrio sp. McD22-P3]MCG9661944.1 sugar-binding transcriptional regulator [Vibrio mediterranei]MCG9787364.1 sugar-binding transcriptional regulator [Vibrio mediterranei]
MDLTNIEQTEETNLLTEIAVAYYQDGATQEEISKRFGLSRVKIGRLLKRARDQGIVEIKVKYHPVFGAKLEEQLKERFGLKRALIALDQPTEDEQRALLAGVVSTYLSSTLKDGMIVSIGQGRNVSSVSEHIGVVNPKKCTFVSSIGGIHPRGGMLNADHISRRFAKTFGGVSETLYAPAYVRNPDLRRALLEDETVQQTMDIAKKADVALVGIGDLNESSYMVNLGWFSVQEMVEARIQQGVVGEVGGYDFYDIKGNVQDTKMSNRVIGLTIADYQKIPQVIAIAAESSKPLSIVGALRTGAVDILATSVANAITILNLDAQQ